MATRQRLGGQDALWLEMDKPGNLMVVDSLFWTEAPIDWDRYREVVKERLWDRYPVFRSVVVRDEHGDWWWEEQVDAELEDRYLHVTLPAPGGDAELQDLIASQRTVPLDRGEPMWRSLLVDGYRGGSAVVFRGHHAIADGIRMVQLSLSVFDASPDGAVVPAQDQARVPDVEHASLSSQVLAQASAFVNTSVQLAHSAVTNPVGAAHTALTISGSLLGAIPALFSTVPGDLDTARKLALGTRNDNTMWTGTVGGDKAIAWSPPVALDDVKSVAHASGATVNDVLVTCVAESLRAYLLKHDAVCHSVTWDVPVNLKPFDPGPARRARQQLRAGAARAADQPRRPAAHAGRGRGAGWAGSRAATKPSSTSASRRSSRG